MKAFKCDACCELREGSPSTVPFRVTYSEKTKRTSIYIGPYGDTTELCDECNDKLTEWLCRFLSLNINPSAKRKPIKGGK